MMSINIDTEFHDLKFNKTTISRDKAADILSIYQQHDVDLAVIISEKQYIEG